MFFSTHCPASADRLPATAQKNLITIHANKHFLPHDAPQSERGYAMMMPW